MEKRQRLCILGATGSVGISTLEVMALHPRRFEVFALSAHHRIDELAMLCLRWRPRFAVVADAVQARRLRERLGQADVPTEVLHGSAALSELAAHPEVDTVMAAIVGAAGLAPCLAAARAGKRLLLANKEALVVGGGLFMRSVQEGGATLLPIDSEHSAIFQCLPAERAAWHERIDHIVLTASGGPFRARDPASLDDVTPEQACAHPNWVMGRKISVDSATMMNKALEVIEAHWLFALQPEQIRVVIHPQSIVHSMVVCRDQSVLAQLGTPGVALRGRHWKIALCSLSIGSSVAPDSRTVRISSGPAMTSDSLLASSSRLPAAAAASVERRPAAPTMAAMTLSTSGRRATSSSAWGPHSTRVGAPRARNSCSSCFAAVASASAA